MRLFAGRKKQEQPKAKIPTRKIYTDKSGTNWFEYVNPLTMPANRAIAAEVATRWSDLKLTKDNLLMLIREIRGEANKGNFTRAFAIIDEIEFRANMIAEEKTLMELAALYYLIDGEDETDLSEMHRQKKMEILDSDGAARAFFLDRSFQLTKDYGAMSDTIITDYLRTHNMDLQRLQRFLQVQPFPTM